ncbi:NAD-dependent epimerase/dehydratase family protein [Flaviflexus huanghaiensis]|uniref:NAD-dependent epimerase/dehydratase family protein n=1 Tax=Flaviflexus huanghaiensis TaxID=1111473 RepID=UPI0015FCD037|nr:NAD-dependent epimerase/dehydratase family protein [Flaviflexus huanghaiensis]
MDVLILGGTGFLSGEAARAFIRRGHAVTCAARGVTGTAPNGASFIPWDRATAPPFDLLEQSPDIVLDISSHPAHVGTALGLFPYARWIYMSSISVYPAMAEPLGGPADTETAEPVTEGGPEDYPGLKVACEQLVDQRSPNHAIVRPGLIVGPGDPTGRFTYWPARIAEAAGDGLPYIAPALPQDPMQWIDVRDLADWIVRLAESTDIGVWEAIGEPMPRETFLAEISTIVEGNPTPIWLDADVLIEQEIGFWSGERALPMYAPIPELAHMMNRDPQPARDQGLVTRPLTQTARDTLRAGGQSSGLSRPDELAVLRTLGYI